MLSTLFTNLKVYVEELSGVEFAENLASSYTLEELKDGESQLIFNCFQELLNFDSTINFAVATKTGYKIQQKNRTITCNPAKTYPCGKSCRSQDKGCVNPIEGQAKTYVAFLELQSKNKSSKKPLDKSDKTLDTGKNKPVKRGETGMKVQFVANTELANLIEKKSKNKFSLYNNVYKPVTTSQVSPRDLQDISDSKVDSTTVKAYETIYKKTGINTIPVFVEASVANGVLDIELNNVVGNRNIFDAAKKAGIDRIQIFNLTGNPNEVNQLNTFFNSQRNALIVPDQAVSNYYQKESSKSKIYTNTYQPTSLHTATTGLYIPNDVQLDSNLVEEYRKSLRGLQNNVIPIIAKNVFDSDGRLIEDKYEVIANREIFEAARLEKLDRVQVTLFNGSKEQADELNLFFRNKSKN